MNVVEIVVDNRIRIRLADLPAEVAQQLRDDFSHTNPKYDELRRNGYPVGDEQPILRTWRHEDGVLSLPRGGMGCVREVLRAAGLRRRVVDERQGAPRTGPRSDFPPPMDAAPRTGPRTGPRMLIPEHRVKLWSFQERIVANCIQREQGIVRAPTGSGKTTAAMALISRVQLPALVVVWTGGLFDQWLSRVVAELGIPAEDVGVIGEGKMRLRPVTIAMQQTIAALSFDEWGTLLGYGFGVVIADELQRFAAPTLFGSIDPFPARIRIGFSADEKRKDGKECLVYDLFGDVLEEVTLEEVEAAGKVLDVEVRVVPTRFSADWYRSAMVGGNAFQKRAAFHRLMTQMAEDRQRNELIVQLTVDAVGADVEQVLLLIERREHASALDRLLTARGLRTGKMLGGASSKKEFRATKEALEAGRCSVAVGTVRAVGTGIDLPAVARMVVGSPTLLSNRQQFGQSRGRVCRTSDRTGKADAVMYVLWDRAIYGRKQLENMVRWNRTVRVLDGGEWVEGRHYLDGMKQAPSISEVLARGRQQQ